MGVYLPNVDMPKGDKTLTIQICPDGSIWQQYRGTVPNAKAVPVPEHGRLIDADALREDWPENGENEYVYDTNAFLDSLDDAPTIIPAEPVEEGET